MVCKWFGTMYLRRCGSHASRSLALTRGIDSPSLPWGTWTRVEDNRSEPLWESYDHVSRGLSW